MKYQTLILVVSVSIVVSGVSTTKVQKLSDIFKQAPRDVQECNSIIFQEQDRCFNETAKNWNVTLDELENAVPGTKIFCCGLWDVFDCMLAAGKVNNLLKKIFASSFKFVLKE